MIRNARSTAPSSRLRVGFVRPGPECGSPSMTSDPKWTPMTTPERIERLREVQPEMAALGRAELGGERIGRNLQRGEARGEDKQSGEDRRRRLRSRCWTTTSRQPLAINASEPRIMSTGPMRLRQPRRRQRQQAVGEKEDDLCEQRFCIVEAERRPQRDDQRVIVRSDEAPGEE